MYDYHEETRGIKNHTTAPWSGVTPKKSWTKWRDILTWLRKQQGDGPELQLLRMCSAFLAEYLEPAVCGEGDLTFLVPPKNEQIVEEKNDIIPAERINRNE